MFYDSSGSAKLLKTSKRVISEWSWLSDFNLYHIFRMSYDSLVVQNCCRCQKGHFWVVMVVWFRHISHLLDVLWLLWQCKSVVDIKRIILSGHGVVLWYIWCKTVEDIKTVISEWSCLSDLAVKYFISGCPINPMVVSSVTTSDIVLCLVLSF